MHTGLQPGPPCVNSVCNELLRELRVLFIDGANETIECWMVVRKLFLSNNPIESNHRGWGPENGVASHLIEWNLGTVWTGIPGQFEPGGHSLVGTLPSDEQQMPDRGRVLIRGVYRLNNCIGWPCNPHLWEPNWTVHLPKSLQRQTLLGSEVNEGPREHYF